MTTANKYLLFLTSLLTMAICFVRPALASESGCKELSNQLLKIRPQIEKLQAESGSQSLLIDKPKRLKHLSKMSDAIKALEVITKKSEKEKCSQYSWFGKTKEEQSQKMWCSFRLQNGFSPSSDPEDNNWEWPTCKCNLSGKQVLEETSPHSPEEKKDASGSVIEVSVHHGGFTDTYFRDHEACKKVEAPFAERMNKLKADEDSKAKAKAKEYE